MNIDCISYEHMLAIVQHYEYSTLQLILIETIIITLLLTSGHVTDSEATFLSWVEIWQAFFYKKRVIRTILLLKCFYIHKELIINYLPFRLSKLIQ